MDASKKPRILLVDDSAATRAVFKSVLEPLGIDIVAAESAAEALGLPPGEDYAAVLLNVRRGGLEVAGRLHQPEPGRTVPLLLLSVHEPSPGVIAEALRVGAYDYLVGPVDLELLKLKVQALVDFHLQQARLSEESSALMRKVAQLERENRALRELAIGA